MPAFAPYHPDFERLQTTLFAKQADRIPLMELGIDEGVMGQFLSRPLRSLEDKIDFFRCAGYDYIKLSPFIDMNPAGITPQGGFRHSEASGADKARKWGSEGQGVITTMEEFERFQFPIVRDEMFLVFEEAERKLPPAMKVIGQYGDIFTFAWEFMGFETFSYCLVENPQLVESVLQRIGAIVYELFVRMAEFDVVGALFYSDDIAYQSGLMASPLFFRKQLFPWMKKIGALCKKRRMPFIYHSDGKLWEVMDDLLDTGITALQPIEPKAWDICTVKERYGRRLALVGNVDVDLLARGTPAAVRQETERLIKTVGPGGGYCVGSGNTVPNYVQVENYRAMLETVWEMGAY
jgi:uroporphyrinogen decarboxylase